MWGRSDKQLGQSLRRPGQRATASGDVGPGITTLGDAVRDVADGEGVGTQAAAVQLIPLQRSSDRRPAPGPDGVWRDRGLPVLVSHDVEVKPVAPLGLARL